MSNFIKLTSVFGGDVYISEVSSIGAGRHGETEIITPSGKLYSVCEPLSEVIIELEKIKSSEVKTLRDEFAMAALNATIIGLNSIVENYEHHGWSDQELVSESYRVADAMLKERSK